METRRTKAQESVKIKEEQVYDYDHQNNSNNGSGVRVKEEAMNDDMEPVEEQFIEISPNCYSKTDQSSNWLVKENIVRKLVTILAAAMGLPPFTLESNIYHKIWEKSKALTKDETRKLLSLILLHPIIISRETKASNNQQKIKEWNEITEQFNATCSVHPRTPKQLRLKWENLKKNARRWSAKNRLNRERADLAAEYLPRDEILEKVSTLLRKRRRNAAKSSDDCDSDESDMDMPVRESVALKTFTTEVPETEEVLLPPTTASETNVISHKTNEFPEMPLRKKKLRTDEGRESRNRAIAGYYAAKTKLLEANLTNVNLQNEKLQMEIELLKRKTNRLKP